MLILGPPAHILHVRLLAAFGARVGVLEFLCRPAEGHGHILDVVIYGYHGVRAESLWFLKSYLEVKRLLFLRDTEDMNHTLRIANHGSIE